MRYYVHGHSVEQIAKELHISAGTVKSRLSSARGQIKEGLKGMEKYDPISYEPKKVTLSIWGGTGFANEPFSLLKILSLSWTNWLMDNCWARRQAG